jgi:hypothetical protein
MNREGKTPDGYVRILTAEVAGVQLRHLISEKDTSIAVPGAAAATITGITEWVGSWRGQTVTVGWDWAVIDGVVAIVNPGEIRTNIRFISHAGAPEPPAIAQIYLLEWIESLPWRDGAVGDLLAGEQLLRPQR